MYQIEYTPGTKNECADCLSRLPQPSTKQQPDKDTSMIQVMDVTTLLVTARDITKATQKDKTLAVTMHLVQDGQCHGREAQLKT